MTVRIDDDELVAVAAAATGVDPRVLLGGCDVAALATVVAAAERPATTTGAAAALLVAMDLHRPFAVGNRAAAWLGAAHVLAGDGLRLDVDPAAVPGLMASRDVRAVEAALAAWARPRTSPLRRLARWLVEPRPATAVTLPCPSCGHPVPLSAGDQCLLHAPWRLTAELELRARCAAMGGPHDRQGVARELHAVGVS